MRQAAAPEPAAGPLDRTRLLRPPRRRRGVRPRPSSSRRPLGQTRLSGRRRRAPHAAQSEAPPLRQAARQTPLSRPALGGPAGGGQRVCGARGASAASVKRDPIWRGRLPAPPARARGRRNERGCPGPGSRPAPKAGRGPLSRRPVRGTAAEPAPATPARDAGPGQPPKLEMPPRSRPPPLPSPAVPLPHVGRAAASGPLPAPSRCH